MPSRCNTPTFSSRGAAAYSATTLARYSTLDVRRGLAAGSTGPALGPTSPVDPKGPPDAGGQKPVSRDTPVVTQKLTDSTHGLRTRTVEVSTWSLITIPQESVDDFLSRLAIRLTDSTSCSRWSGPAGVDPRKSGVD